MSARSLIPALLLTLGLAPACDKKEEATPAVKADDAKQAKADAPEPELEPAAAPLPEEVAKAVELAKAIEADPGKADEILAKHGMDRAGLDALMYEIAKSPELSAAYQDARAG